VLCLDDVKVGAPGRDELLIRHTAIGVNFHDTYVRSGLYRTLSLPGIPGIEAAGVVEQAGSNSFGFNAGDRIAYVDAGYGAYSQRRILQARLAVRLPPTVDDESAATITLKGLAACMLLQRVHRVVSGQTVLVHAAAGGVGQLLVRWAKHLGATVIATVGSNAKAQITRENGADVVIQYRDDDFVERVKVVTNGRGVDVVYDSVGKDTFQGSLDCLAYFGKLVSFGQSSGAVDPFPISRLSQRSTGVVRPYLFHYIRNRATLKAWTQKTYHALSTGIIEAIPSARFPLSRAADAHRALESRATTGSIVLTP